MYRIVSSPLHKTLEGMAGIGKVTDEAGDTMEEDCIEVDNWYSGQWRHVGLVP
jgi:hypothetical protein